MRDAALLWGSALALALIGTALLFEASAGVNWGIWTLGAVTAIAAWSRRAGAGSWWALCPLLSLAVAIAAGAAVTAAGCFHALIVCVVAALLAMAVLFSVDARWDSKTASFMLWAPIVTPLYALVEALARALGLIELVATPGNRPRLRGALLAVPIVGVFGLMLANADPVLARLRDDLADALERLAFVPRLAFFSTILAGAVGAGGLVVRRAVVRTPSAPGLPTPRLGDTERLIVLGAVVALFASFLLLQLSYLFGNTPARVGSGITFSEYARRGFGELTAVATLCALLLALLDRFASRGAREHWVRVAGVAMILEVQILLISALRRLWLYEQAYGFTTLRLYAHVYMIAVAVILCLLGWELSRDPSPARLTRRAAGVGALALLVLIFWNYEAWIVRENIARYLRTGQVDTLYLSGLSPNAIPAIVGSLPMLPEPQAGLLREAFQWRYSASAETPPCRWFEWNLRRRQAAEALLAAAIVPAPVQFGPRPCSWPPAPAGRADRRGSSPRAPTAVHGIRGHKSSFMITDHTGMSGRPSGQTNDFSYRVGEKVVVRADLRAAR